MSAPTAVFTRGPADSRADRLADAFLALRPGLLIVLT